MLGVIKAVLFFASSFGYVCFFKKKAGISLYFAPIFIISVISLFLFFGGLLGILKESAYVLLTGGLLCLALSAVSIINMRRKNLPLTKQAPDLCGIILLLGTLIFTLLVLSLRLLHYDNFSHWAVIVKYLLSADRFPQPDTKIVVFLDYPPGSAVFIYYVCRFLGNSQGVMLAAQNLMVFSCFYCVFGIVKEKRRFLLYSFLGMGCSLLSYLNLTIRINNLLVDFLLPLLSLASICAAYSYKEQPLFISVYSFFLLGFTTTVKGTGIVFALISYVYYLYTVFYSYAKTENGKLKKAGRIKRLFMCLFTGCGMCMPYALWKYRMDTVFSDYESKFSIDTSEIGGQYSSPSKELHGQIINDFINASFDLTSRAAQVFFLCNIIALIALIFVRVKRKKKWNLGKLLVIADIVVVLYYIGILYMYLYSMPEEEAVNLAGFDRYACSIITLFAGILVVGTAVNMESTFSVGIDERGAYKAYSSPSAKRLYQYGVLFTLVLGVNFIYSEINGLISIREDYWNTLPGKVENIAGDVWVKGGEENTSRYLVIASDINGQVSSGEVRYVSRYFLYSPNVYVTERLSIENLKIALDNYDYIMVVDKEAVNLQGDSEKLSFLNEAGLYKTSEISESMKDIFGQ